jgi:MFS transporter, NNP family, nitrate/nitrite transporter
MTQKTMPLPVVTGAAAPSENTEAIIARQRMRVLWLSFIGFALLFAAWTMFGVLGIPIRNEFGLTDMQLAWLSAIAILNGALWRLPLGVLADRTGLAGGFVPGGWRFVPFLYSLLLLTMAAIIFLFAPTPDKKPGQGRAFGEMFAPLKEIRVWRFSLYYTVVFGAYVALSVWLPKYYVDVYGLPLTTAALVTTPFILASSLLRPLGGWFSDKYGPRKVTYAVFAGGALFSALLTLPQNVYTFSALIFCLGITQGFGKASTIKYIPNYYPKDVGAVVGLVGAIAAIGGFALPPLFALLKAATGQPQALFYALFALSAVSLLWLHVVVTRIHREEHDAI